MAMNSFCADFKDGSNNNTYKPNNFSNNNNHDNGNSNNNNHNNDNNNHNNNNHHNNYRNNNNHHNNNTHRHNKYSNCTIVQYIIEQPALAPPNPTKSRKKRKYKQISGDNSNDHDGQCQNVKKRKLNTFNQETKPKPKPKPKPKTKTKTKTKTNNNELMSGINENEMRNSMGVTNVVISPIEQSPHAANQNETKWTCSICTFLNAISELSCSMCDSSRSNLNTNNNTFSSISSQSNKSPTTTCTNPINNSNNVTATDNNKYEMSGVSSSNTSNSSLTPTNNNNNINSNNTSSISTQWIQKCRAHLLEWEQQNIISRAKSFTKIVNDTRDEINTLVNIHNYKEFETSEFKHTITDLNDKCAFVTEWSGVIRSKSSLSSYTVYLAKGKNWLKGKRARNYSEHLFFEMMINAQKYAMNISNLIFSNDDKPIKSMYADLLLDAIIYKVCSTKILISKRRGSRPAALICTSSYSQGKFSSFLQKYSKKNISCEKETTNVFRNKYHKTLQTFKAKFMALND